MLSAGALRCLPACAQGNGCLVVFEASPEDAVYSAALETIANLDRVVDSLAAKSAKALTA